MRDGIDNKYTLVPLDSTKLDIVHNPNLDPSLIAYKLVITSNDKTPAGSKTIFLDAFTSMTKDPLVAPFLVINGLGFGYTLHYVKDTTSTLQVHLKGGYSTNQVNAAGIKVQIYRVAGDASAISNPSVISGAVEGQTLVLKNSDSSEVDIALPNAVNEASINGGTLSFDKLDGTSTDIVLPSGKHVVSGEIIRGHVVLTMSDGTTFSFLQTAPTSSGKSPAGLTLVNGKLTLTAVDSSELSVQIPAPVAPSKLIKIADTRATLHSVTDSDINSS